MGLDSLRGSSIKFGAMQRRLAWPPRKDDNNDNTNNHTRNNHSNTNMNDNNNNNNDSNTHTHTSRRSHSGESRRGAERA